VICKSARLASNASVPACVEIDKFLASKFLACCGSVSIISVSRF
jgi:hypothetical protein